MVKYLFLYFWVFFVFSCNSVTKPRIFSGNSFYRSGGIGSRMISSENILLHRTTIYPDVTDYAYDEDFIIAKQKPNKENSTLFLSQDLYVRYTSFREYLNNPQKLNEKEYSGFIEKMKNDTINYRMFAERGHPLSIRRGICGLDEK